MVGRGEWRLYEWCISNVSLKSLHLSTCYTVFQSNTIPKEVSYLVCTVACRMWSCPLLSALLREQEQGLSIKGSNHLSGVDIKPD